MVAVARFVSQGHARVTGSLPDQQAWCAEVSKAFDDGIVVRGCPVVDVLLDGGSDEAGFVQVVQGRAVDRHDMRHRLHDFAVEVRQLRTDVIGATVAWDGDRRFTQTTYFTSEPDARRGEMIFQRSPLFGRFMSMTDGELDFYDLEDVQFV